MKSILVSATFIGLLTAAFAMRSKPKNVFIPVPAAEVRVTKVIKKASSSQTARVPTVALLNRPPKTVELDWESLDLMRESGRSSEVLQLLLTRVAAVGMSAEETAMITAEIGSIYLLDLHQSEEALAWYERSVLSAPNDRNVVHQLASLYESTGQEEAGVEFLTKINIDNASIGTFFELGRLQLRKKSYSEAVQSLEQAAYRDNDADTHYLLGLALRGNGNQTLACEHLIQAMEALKNDSKLQFSSLSEKVVAEDLASCDYPR